LIVIGIDFSIQFPAVCIAKDFKEFSWISCVNANLTKAHSKLLDDVCGQYSNITIRQLEPRKKIPKDQETYSGTERNKLSNYSNLVDSLIHEIKLKIGNDDKVIVAIEGIAYGAQGNALIDISQSTGMLRKTLLDKILLGKSEKLFIFSPGELKNAIGAKGNAGKFDVFSVFMENPLLALDSDLHACINMNIDNIIKNQQVMSPFMDMIDAYLAVLKVHSLLKESN
jgi:hypothetical protein